VDAAGAQFRQLVADASGGYRLPNPSSLKDLLVDQDFYINLRKRLDDEAEDLHSNNRIKAMAYSIRHLASGTYGRGSNSWNPNRETRCDSAGRRRQIQRMNRRVRIKNL